MQNINISSIEYHAERAYTQARRSAFMRWLRCILTRKRRSLLTYDDIREYLEFGGQHELGVQVVPTDRIVGSLGRAEDFDFEFMPSQEDTRERWLNVARAYFTDRPLPPVELYKIGTRYFVVDGNHRISVARAVGQDFIEAHVIEIQTPTRLTAVIEQMR